MEPATRRHRWGLALGLAGALVLALALGPRVSPFDRTYLPEPFAPHWPVVGLLGLGMALAGLAIMLWRQPAKP